MDIMTFLSEIAKTMIWPLTIVAVILILRKPIRVLILSLRRFQYGDLAIEFGRQVYKLAEKFRNAMPEAGEIISGEKDPDADLLKNSARNAVVRAVRDLESAAREISINKILDQEQSGMFDKLMDLGRMAVLVPDHSLDICALRDYLRLTRQFTVFLEEKKG
jgi:hypothetical protein